MTDDRELVPRKAGLPPGSPIYIGAPRPGPTTMHLMTYGEGGFSEKEVSVEEAISALRSPPKDQTLWVDVRGLTEASIVAAIGEAVGLHALTVEDVLNTTKRPKTEVFEHYTVIILKMIYPGAQPRFHAEQVSLVVRPGLVVSFQECGSDTFGAVRNRIRLGRGRIRASGSPYLVYALIDSIVDGYFLGIEQLGEELSTVEQLVLSEPSPRVQSRLLKLKRTAMFIRRAVWPVRELLSGLLRGDSPHMPEELRPYLNDVYDHSIEVLDILESAREMVGGLLDLHVATVGNRLNEIMKVLTIFSAIFMPLTFIAGVYGMNFHHMPELTWRYGYAGALLVMVATTASLVLYFRRKKWI